MEKQKLKYLGYSIVLEEVPDEISLAINISGCPHKCEGCHSKYLWKDDGEILEDNLDKLLDKYGDYITCVCFMGGDQDLIQLWYCCKKVKERGLKVCIYTGYDTMLPFAHLSFFSNSYMDNGFVDYIKTGRYHKYFGGLNNKSTNQRMYRILDKDNMIDGLRFKDITYRFQRGLKDD